MGVNAIAATIISNCKLCYLRNKKFLHTPEGRLTKNVLPWVGGQFRLTYIDLAGPIHFSHWNNQKVGLRGSTSASMYILVGVCGVTKCVKLVPCSSQDTGAITLAIRG